MSDASVSDSRGKAAVSVSHMARTIGLSRSRFYDYIRRGVFPQPLYSTATKRPFYTSDMQQDIQDVRQTGIGCNGEYVLFYEKGQMSQSSPPKTPEKKKPPEVPSHLIESLKDLGIVVTPPQLAEALMATFPGGTVGTDEAVILRTVYRYLRRRKNG